MPCLKVPALWLDKLVETRRIRSRSEPRRYISRALEAAPSVLSSGDGVLSTRDAIVLFTLFNSNLKRLPISVLRKRLGMNAGALVAVGSSLQSKRLVRMDEAGDNSMVEPTDKGLALCEMAAIG